MVERVETDPLVETLVEDRADRAVGQRSDLDRSLSGRFQPQGAEGFGQSQDADAGAKALFGMGSSLEDEFAKDASRRADKGSLLANPIDGPVSMAAMAGWHVIAKGGVPAVAARANVSGDPLAPGKDLDRARGDPGLYLLAGEAKGNAVEVLGDLDVIVEIDPTTLPLGVLVGLVGQRRECRMIEFIEQFTPTSSPAP